MSYEDFRIPGEPGERVPEILGLSPRSRIEAG